VSESPTLTVDSPVDGAQFENGSIPVKGSTTNATSVSVSAIMTATADGTPVATPPPTPAASGAPAGSAAPAATPAADGTTVGPVTVTVADDGTFDAPLDLAAGSWQIVITATSDQGKTTTLTRAVSVKYQGVNLVITIKSSRAWLKVWVDGKLSKVTGAAGTVYDPGKVLTFTANDSVEVRTGKSSATYFTLNGENLGHMSNKPSPETWLFAPPDPPTKTNRT
jgi:hypothetical protein